MKDSCYVFNLTIGVDNHKIVDRVIQMIEALLKFNGRDESNQSKNEENS